MPSVTLLSINKLFDLLFIVAMKGVALVLLLVWVVGGSVVFVSPTDRRRECLLEGGCGSFLCPCSQLSSGILRGAEVYNTTKLPVELILFEGVYSGSENTGIFLTFPCTIR